MDCKIYGRRYCRHFSGSSNLTEAGIGLKHTNNLELNIAETGNNNQYKELVEWFAELWKKPQAHQEKTLIFKDGSRKKVNFKQYLIAEIEKIFIEYTPRDIYYKILFELFGNQILEIENNPEFNRQIGRLENTAIFHSLYDFQKKGALSLIRMLQKYDGAILADAVGLGKTWSALTVIKFFQMQGREVILLCPKKLESNWRRYKEDQESKFESDKLKFFIRFHTDMNSDRLNSYNDRADKLFCDDKPKLIVIDESHNLRNDKSQRYKFLIEQILQKNQDIKVLLISATPINNSLNDARNQFKLMVQGNVHGYETKLGIKNFDHQYQVFDLIYINKSGNLILNNQKEVLDFLTLNKEKGRFVPDAVDRGDESAIAELVNALKAWLSSQIDQEPRDLLAKIKKGNKSALEIVKQNIKVDEKFQVDKFDLVAWVLVSAD